MKKYSIIIIAYLFVICNLQLQAQNTRLWGTYYGGTEIGINESGNGTDTDPFGNVYIAGTISSNSGIATFGAFQTIYGGGNRDAFLVKFDANGNRLWGTYYGASGLETGFDTKTDAAGNVYLLANALTGSTGLATTGAFQTTSAGGTDVLLVKFDANGNRLWATYYGGSGADVPSRLAVDGLGNVYVVGLTNGNNGVASGGFQNTIGGGEDLFLVKFDSTGNRLWATYYGGSGNENGVPSVAIDCDNNVYITGTTTSSSNIAFNGFQNSLSGVEDAFLVKFDANGNRLWSTYYGGPGSPGIFGVSDIERTLGISTDITGNVYIVGQTTSTVNIAFNGHDNVYTPANPIISAGISYLVKFNSSGNRLWGTYYGDENATGWSVTTDICGNVYMSGTTTDLTPPANVSTLTGFQQANGGNSDAFLVMFDSTGIRQWGTYYGGSGVEGVGIGEITLDNNSNLYIVGTTRSANAIATSGAFKTTITGVTDIYLAKFTTGGCAKFVPICSSPLVVSSTFNSNLCNGQCVGNANAAPTGGTPPYTYTWNTGDTVAAITNLCAGTYVVTVTDSLSNVATDTVVISEPALISFTQNPVICQGASVIVNGNVYTTSGIFNDTLFGGAANGCDSMITTNLTILPTVINNANASICQGDSILLGGVFQTTAGNYNDTLFGGAANGCDSIITTTLTVTPSATSNQNPIICQGQTFTLPSGSIVNTSGTFIDTLQNAAANGCDSIVTTNLTVNPAVSFVQNFNECQGFLVTVGTNNYTTTGNFIDTLTAASGCDSVVTTNLTITIPTKTTNVLNECEGFSVTVGTNIYTTTGVFIDVINNCDTIVTDLTINPIPQLTIIKADDNCGENTGSVTANVISANPPITYIWNTGSTDSIINNLPAGTYTLTINDASGCVNSDTINVLDLEIECETFIFIPNVFTPNGDEQNDEFIIKIKGLEFRNLEIYNRWGLKLFESTDINKGWDGRATSGSEAADGTYFFIVNYNQNNEIKTATGTLTLLR